METCRLEAVEREGRSPASGRGGQLPGPVSSDDLGKKMKTFFVQNYEDSQGYTPFLEIILKYTVTSFDF